jgi:hypothetical protein
MREYAASISIEFPASPYVRDRDTGEQEVVRIDELVGWLRGKGC